MRLPVVLGAVVASAAAWEGGSLGFLIGLLGVVFFWKLLDAIEAPDGVNPRSIASRVAAITALWGGSWASGRAVSGVDWDKARAWYLAMLALTTGIFVVPQLAIVAYKRGKRRLQSP